MVTVSRRGISATGAGVIVVVLIVAALGAYYLTMGSGTSMPPSTTGSTTTASSVVIMVPADATTSTGCWSSNPGGCSDSNATTGAEVSNLYFSPDNVTLVIGQNNTVVWKNPNGVAHTVTSTTVPSGATSFNLQLSANGEATYTFTVPGVYYYHCTIHPWMGGEVIVKGVSSSTMGGY